MAGSVECVNGCTTKTGKPSTHSLKNCPLAKQKRFTDGTPLENTAPAGILSFCASLITNADGVPRVNSNGAMEDIPSGDVNHGPENLPPGNENPIKHGMEIDHNTEDIPPVMEINHNTEDIPPVYKNPIDDLMDTFVSPVTSPPLSPSAPLSPSDFLDEQNREDEMDQDMEEGVEEDKENEKSPVPAISSALTKISKKRAANYSYKNVKRDRTKAFHNTRDAMKKALEKIDAQTGCYGILYLRRYLSKS